MKFTLRHTFANVDLPTFEACYFDEAFNVALCHHAKLQREVVTLQRDAERLRRAVRIVPERQLPAPIAKLMGAERLGYTEQLDYLFGSYHVDWQVLSAVMTDKVHSAGTVDFAADGHGGVVRTVCGEISVRVFGLGGTIERFVVADVEKSYDDAAAFMARYLADAKRS